MRASIFRALALGGTLGLASVVGGCAAIAGLDKDYVFTGGDDAGATDGDARADAGPSSVAICSANHMFATESMSAECRQALVPNC
ncbi:MAG: hypothetical protein U0169_26295 [Polyangiaceae bacterium]